MKILVTTCAVVGALMLSGTSASAQNSANCHNQALAYANAQTNPAAGGVAGGVIGAVGGGLLGKVLGKGNKAVAPGAVAGGVAGAALGVASETKKRDQLYQQAFAACMSQAIPANYQGLPVGSPEWTYQCDLKYKSFVADPASPLYGTYQPFRDPSGALPPRRLCELP